MRTDGHILTWLLFSICLIVHIWLQSTLSGLMILFFVILAIAIALKQAMAVLRHIRWMAVFLFIFMVIQLFIRQDGVDVIWMEQLIIPFGRGEWLLQFRLTSEALTETCISAVRFLMFALVFLTVSPLMPGKRLLSYASKWIPHGAQMMYLTLRLVPFLKSRSEQLQNILETRGFQPDLKRNWRETIRIRLPFLEALLEETLEGAWHRAESMVARGYGRTKRTQFRAEKWAVFDFFVILIIFISFYFSNFPIILMTLFIPVLFFVINHKNSSFHSRRWFRL